VFFSFFLTLQKILIIQNVQKAAVKMKNLHTGNWSNRLESTGAAASLSSCDSITAIT